MTGTDILFAGLKRGLKKALETIPGAAGANMKLIILHIDCEKNEIIKTQILTDKGVFELTNTTQ